MYSTHNFWIKKRQMVIPVAKKWNNDQCTLRLDFPKAGGDICIFFDHTSTLKKFIAVCSEAVTHIRSYEEKS